MTPERLTTLEIFSAEDVNAIAELSSEELRQLIVDAEQNDYLGLASFAKQELEEREQIERDRAFHLDNMPSGD